MHPPAPRRGLARCPPSHNHNNEPAAMGRRRQPLSCQRGASGCQAMPLTGAGPGPCLPALMTLVYSARHNGVGNHAAKPAPPPPSPTSLPGAAPLAISPHGRPPGPRPRQQARPRTGTMMPLDGEDFAPHPAALIISHIADRRGSA